jgi:hypothetical protein
LCTYLAYNPIGLWFGLVLGQVWVMLFLTGEEKDWSGYNRDKAKNIFHIITNSYTNILSNTGW